MIENRKNKKAIAAIALSVASVWGPYAMAAESAKAPLDQAGHANHAAPDEKVLKKGDAKTEAPAAKGSMQDMDHSKMDHSSHGGMSMDGMQGGSAPPDARDPHAESGGYGFSTLNNQVKLGGREVGNGLGKVVFGFVGGAGVELPHHPTQPNNGQQNYAHHHNQEQHN